MYEYEVSWDGIRQSRVNIEARSPYKAYRSFLDRHKIPLEEIVVVERNGKVTTFGNHFQKSKFEHYENSRSNQPAITGILLLALIFGPFIYLAGQVGPNESSGDIWTGYFVYCVWLLISFLIQINKSNKCT